MTQAFHFSAVDYLLKPVDNDLLTEAVKRGVKRIEEKTGGQHIETFLHNIQHKGGPQKMKLPRRGTLLDLRWPMAVCIYQRLTARFGFSESR